MTDGYYFLNLCNSPLVFDESFGVWETSLLQVITFYIFYNLHPLLGSKALLMFALISFLVSLVYSRLGPDFCFPDLRYQSIECNSSLWKYLHTYKITKGSEEYLVSLTSFR